MQKLFWLAALAILLAPAYASAEDGKKDEQATEQKKDEEKPATEQEDEKTKAGKE